MKRIKLLVAFACRHPFAVLLGLGLVTLGGHLTTVVDYPASWFDEIEIIEMGRFSVFDIRPEWSVNLLQGADGVWRAPAPYFHYLIGAWQELAYRLTGSYVPARISLLVTLPIASLALFGWLRTKRLATGAALLAAIFFLFDPNATICAHWYRPDLLTMACAFAAMILLARTHSAKPPMRRLACVAAGGLAALMAFLWITSVLLWPLIAWEAFVSAADDPAHPFRSWCGRRLAQDMVACIVGAVITASVLLIPLYPYIPDILDQYARHSELGRAQFAWGDVARHAFDFVRIALRSPFVWLLAGLGLLRGRCRMHGVLWLGLCGLMVLTRVYHLRMVQLMPFLFLFLAIALDWLLRHPARFVRAVSRFAIVCAGVGYFGLSVVAMNYAAWPGGNTFRAFTTKLAVALPTRQGSPKVYLHDMEHEIYYSGRELGWRMYSCTERSELFTSPEAARILDGMDVFVASSMLPPLTDAELAVLADHGFRECARVVMPPSAGSALKRALAALFYAHGYPSCAVYARPVP